MSEENGATALADPASFPETIRDLGERIVNMTVLDVQKLGDYLEQVHGIKAAAGGGMMMAMPAAGGGGEAAAAAEPTEFDVILKEGGPKKIEVIKVVRTITNLGLKEAKALVEEAPKPVKENCSKEDAAAIKKQLEEAGASVEVKGK